LGSNSNGSENNDDDINNTNNINNKNSYQRIILSDILKQQKKACLVREDVLFEVKAMAERENFRVVGSPFEADTQLIALMNQGVIDYVLTNDSDIPFQGCTQTIMRLSKSNNSSPCCLVNRSSVLDTFKISFESERELNNTDLSLFACLLGNDYIDRSPGQGPVSAISKMKDWVKLQNNGERDKWLGDHVSKLKQGNRQNFYMAFEHWLHGPAFFVVPDDESISPRDAFEKGEEAYTIDLRAMDNKVGRDEKDFWFGLEGENKSNLRLGFLPNQELRNNHDQGSGEEVSYQDMFQMKK